MNFRTWLRWRIALLMNRFPDTCWTDLVLWATLPGIHDFWEILEMRGTAGYCARSGNPPYCGKCAKGCEFLLQQARRELAAVDEALGEFYCPVLDPETEEPCGPYFLNHGVHIMGMELERLREENDKLRDSACLTGTSRNAVA